MVFIVCTGGCSMEIISDEGKMFFGARIFGQKLSFRYFGFRMWIPRRSKEFGEGQTDSVNEFFCTAQFFKGREYSL